MLRTHTCGELRITHLAETVTVAGWMQSRRDHGGVIFVDLRDRYGLTQVVFEPTHNPRVHEQADTLRREYVVKVTGKVRARREGMENPKLDTGQIEILADELEILNAAETPPFEIDDRTEASEDLRLQYRYLDLRRPIMRDRIIFRHKVVESVREYLNSKGFLEIETPLLIRSTPEGARDYLVPSRVHPGKAYSLPQSPQLYKQILMVAGFDKYYQIARCLRDEDLRADRQPEFTQIDVEMSFLHQEDVFDLGDGLMQHIVKKTKSLDLKLPLARMTYDEAMETYGTDKPDIRFSLPLCSVTEIVKDAPFSVFKDVIEKKGIVKALRIPKGTERFSRKEIEAFSEFVKQHKAKGLAYVKVAGGKLESNIAKYLEACQEAIIEKTAAQEGDYILFIADSFAIANEALAQLRKEIGKRLRLYDEGQLAFLWVNDFPSFLWSEEDQVWEPAHHIFTMPKYEHLQYLETDPGKVRAQCYDLVLNGIEIASGSIRIHRADIQERVMKVIGLTHQDAQRKFGFLLEAFRYGAPPHGGFAPGVDRLVALLLGFNDIREVIAFPKNKAAENPMDGCPSPMEEKSLKELHMKVDVFKKEQKNEPKNEHAP